MKTEHPDTTTPPERLVLQPEGLAPSRWWHRILWGLLPVTPLGAAFVARTGAVKLLALYCALAALLYVALGILGIAQALGLKRSQARPPRPRPTAPAPGSPPAIS
jgi:hypothetical protein